MKIITRDKALLVSVVVILAVYAVYREYSIGSMLARNQDDIAALNRQVVTLNQSVATLADQGQNFVAKLDTTAQQSNAVQDQISKVSSTVGTLDKLSKTDPQLLQKYSKVYFLNEHYVPPNLSTLEAQYTYDQNVKYQIHSEVFSHLIKMMDTAKNQGANLLVISAYRSYGTQAALKQSYKVTYGAGTANKFSADQGYSEHQLGTTLDFTTPTVKATFDNFDKTVEYNWLTNHAHEYGFILSYPQNNKYYVYEPWHWRYVGVALATKLHNEGRYFYDHDQRAINDFLVNLFD